MAIMKTNNHATPADGETIADENLARYLGTQIQYLGSQVEKLSSSPTPSNTEQ